MALRVDLTGWNHAIKAEHPKAAVLHEAEVEGRPASPLDLGLMRAKLTPVVGGHPIPQLSQAAGEFGSPTRLRTLQSGTNSYRHPSFLGATATRPEIL